MSDRGGTARGSSDVNPGLVLLPCCGATFMAFLDLSVVNIAFAEIVSTSTRRRCRP